MYGHILQKVDASDAHASLSLAKVLHEKLGDFSRARDVFATAANANPTNYKILQAWAVMEARGEDTKEDPTKSPTENTFKQKRALKKQESSAESRGLCSSARVSWLRGPRTSGAPGRTRSGERREVRIAFPKSRHCLPIVRP